jgi:polysaccharide biosynthesis protein PslG
MYPDNPGTGGWSQDASFYFRRLEQLHAVMEEFGDARPIWVTEFGWTTANQAPGYEYGVDITEQEQAEYLVRAFEIARTQWAWCTGMFVWHLNYAVISPPEDEKYPWGTLNGDWSPRPSYEALKNMPKD